MNAEREMATADGLGAGYSDLVLSAMREWIADSGLVYSECGYEQTLELLHDAEDGQIVKFVERRYAGGVKAFIREGDCPDCGYHPDGTGNQGCTTCGGGGGLRLD